jgi:hypothetical protein
MFKVPSSPPNVKPRRPDYRQVIREKKLVPTIDDEVDEPGIRVWNGRQATHPDGSRTSVTGALKAALRQMILTGEFNFRLPSKHWRRKPHGLSLKEFDKQANELMSAASLPDLVPTLTKSLTKSGFTTEFIREVLDEGFGELDIRDEEYWRFLYIFDGRMRNRDNGDPGKVQVLPILRNNLFHFLEVNAGSSAGDYIFDIARVAFELQIAGDTAEGAASSVRFRQWLDRCPS